MWTQQDRQLAELPKITGVGRFLGGFNANFLRMQILNNSAAEGGVPDNRVAMAVYEALATEKGVFLQLTGKEPGCFGAIRVTVGTEKENDDFFKAITTVLAEVLYMLWPPSGKDRRQSRIKRELAANDIVA